MTIIGSTPMVRWPPFLFRPVFTAVLLCTAPLQSVIAAGPQSEASPRPANAAAFHAYDAGRYDAARIRFELAVTQARVARDPAAEADAQRGLGMTLYKLAEYADARAALEAALRLYETLGDHSGAGWTLHHLGWLAYSYDGDKPLDLYWRRGLEEMQAAGDRKGEAQLLSDRAGTLPAGPEKMAALERALQLARDAGATKTAGEVLLRIGQLRMWEGSYAVALETLETALDAFERIGAKGWAGEALLQLGLLHERHGSRDRAGQLYRRALAILQHSDDKQRTVQVLGAIVNMHRAAGQLPQAVTASRAALALRLTLGDVRGSNLERLRLAWLLLDTGRASEAMPLVDAVMQGADSFSRDLGYAPLANAHLALGNYAEAREAAGAAIKVTREPVERPFMLETRAKAAEKLGDSAGALADIDAALGLVEEARARLVPSDLMKQGYGDRLQRLFGYAIELKMRLGRAEAALEAAEQARARAFLDLLAAHGGPLASAAGAGEVRSVASAPHASVEQLVANARRLESVIVSYWMQPGETFIWIIDPEGRVNSASIRVPARHLASLIGRTSEEIGVTGRASTTVWRELYDTLIRPVQQFLPRGQGGLLTIVPHGPLFRLSFAALLDERHTYLIERYRLHYVPSGGALSYLAGQSALKLAPSAVAVPNATARAGYLFVADPAARPAAGKVAPPSLPGAMHEVQAIAKMLPPGTGTILTGTQATEDRLRGLVRGQRVIHLATHGQLNDNPRVDSFFVLSGRGAATAEDGRLTVAEIYDLTLDAELVVLSACKSARGPITGDGVLGMTRAFMSAGAPSIVATLWDMADRAGAELMPLFYRSWHNGSSKSASLRDAQLEMIARLRQGRVTVDTPGGRRALPEHPFLWAAFVLVGKP